MIKEQLTPVNWETIIWDIATSLQLTSEYVFETLVSGMYVEGWIGLICLVVAFIISLELFFLSVKLWKIHTKNTKKSAYSIDSSGFDIFSVVAFALGICFLMYSIFSIKTSAIKIINPEYAAIQHIVNHAK